MDERYTKFDQDLTIKVRTLKEKFDWNPKGRSDEENT